MMGLPAGHVTDPAIGLTRAQQLKALGNGVVPQQAALAIAGMLGVGAAPAAGGRALLPTPMTVNRTSDRAKSGRPTSGPQRGGASYGLEDVLLPTPAVNDMGAGKTPADWDEWTEARLGESS